MDKKTAGQVMYETLRYHFGWDTISPGHREQCEKQAAAVIANVRPQIEQEARKAERDRCAAECKRLFGAGKKVNGVMFGTSALDCAEAIENLK